MIDQTKIKEAKEAIIANYPPSNYTMLREGLDFALSTLSKLERGEIVEICRCKDCAYRGNCPCSYEYEYDDDGYLEHDTVYIFTTDNAFCSYGERKEQGDENNS